MKRVEHVNACLICGVKFTTPADNDPRTWHVCDEAVASVYAADIKAALKAAVFSYIINTTYSTIQAVKNHLSDHLSGTVALLWAHMSSREQSKLIHSLYLEITHETQNPKAQGTSV